ncbi:MAG: hypothetical protein QG597_714 [Actinomycetota bacterium]|nr:hypothetical protein [Actinomycetota bacterium]
MDSWWLSLQWYRRGQGYLDHRPRGRRYYDDNAWLGLVAAQEGILTGADRWWARAGQIARFVAEGATESGAVCWVEGGDTRNACSTGSAALLFDALAREAPGLAPSDRTYFSNQAEAARAFLQGPLMRSDGLVADHVRPDGSVEPSVWAYNQALLLQLESRRGDDAAADTVADAVERGMPAPVMAHQPAVFACIWWRALLAHRARQGAQAVPEVERYLHQAWDRGRDAQGLFRGVSRYDAGVVLDHVSVTGLLAAYAAGPTVWRALL